MDQKWLCASPGTRDGEPQSPGASPALQHHHLKGKLPTSNLGIYIYLPGAELVVVWPSHREAFQLFLLEKREEEEQVGTLSKLSRWHRHRWLGQPVLAGASGSPAGMGTGCCRSWAPQQRVPRALGDAARDRLRVVGLSRVISL